MSGALVLFFGLVARYHVVKREMLHAQTGYHLARERDRVLKTAAAGLTSAPDRAAIAAVARQAALDLGQGFPGMSVHVDILDQPSMARSPGAIPPVSGGWMAPDLVLTVPLTTESTVYGMIVASATIPLPPDISESLETLAAQVTLALEAVALTEDLNRHVTETRVTALIQNSSDVVTVLDSELKIRYVTPSVTRVLGHDVGRLLGRPLVDIIHPDDKHRVRSMRTGLRSLPAGSNRVEWRMRRGDGRWVDVESVSNDLLDHPDVNGLVVTTRDVTDRKALEDGLKEQVEKLRDLDRIKNEFVATVSHELRTPIASIIGQAEMLEDGDFDPLTPRQASAVEVIDRNSHRLLMLIEDLLTLNQIESGGLRLHRRTTDLAALVDQGRRAVQQVADARRITVDVDLALGLGHGDVDPAQLDRALVNLLSNAVKFSPEGGRVRLQANRRGGALVVSVADNGIGIPEDEKDRLFTRFFRSSVAVKMAIQGTGLGLVIVKRIVEEHGGTVTLDSELGRGTTVTMTVPLHPANIPLRASA